MEQSFIEWLRATIPSAQRTRVGIGDDAAVLNWSPHSDLVVTSDLLADGTHFHLADDHAEAIGRKALAVNLSDLAAMGARPVGVTVSLLLPRVGASDLAQRLIHGMLPLCEQFGVAIVGGDTNTWDQGLVLDVTAFGQMDGQPPLTRAEARPGDVILVTGELGGSLMGRHMLFVPRIDEAILLRNHSARACMDISDGLTLDLSRMMAASGCGAELDLDAIPISPDAVKMSLQAENERSPLEHALGDGEDFELIVAIPADQADRLIATQPMAVMLTRIGQFIEEEGLWGYREMGDRRRLEPAGYLH